MSALQKLKEVVGLKGPAPMTLEQLEARHAELFGERQNFMSGLGGNISKLPPRITELDAELEALRPQIATLRAQKSKENEEAKLLERNRLVHEAAERGRHAAKAKPPSDAPVKAAQRALTDAEATHTKAAAAHTKGLEAREHADQERSKCKAAYDAKPSDAAWSAFEASESKAKRAQVDAARLAAEAKQAADAMAEAKRALALAEHQHRLALVTLPIDDALAAEAIAIFDRAVAWFTKARERQRAAFATHLELLESARALGLPKPESAPELTLSAYGLAMVAAQLWAAAKHVDGDGPATVAKLGDVEGWFDATLTLDAPPGTNRNGGAMLPEQARARFDMTLIERAARALAR